jgi:hypothetical protein
VADGHGDLATLLADLQRAESETALSRDRREAILRRRSHEERGAFSDA